MAEGSCAVEVPHTTSVKGERRPVYLTRGMVGRVVLTVYAGKKPVDVVIPIRELMKAVKRVEEG